MLPLFLFAFPMASADTALPIIVIHNGVNGNYFFRLPPKIARRASWAVLFCLSALVETKVFSQEALRTAIAGDTSAAAVHQAETTLGYYNLLLGPTAWQFKTGLGLVFNDNVHLNEGNPESDFIIEPNVAAQLHWPVSLKNSLDAALGIGYNEYVIHSELSQLYIQPGSGLSFDVYLGNVKVNLHDRISISQYAYQNAGAGGNNQSLVNLQNTVGVSAALDLDKGVLNAGYDHNNYVSLSQSQSQPDASSDNLYANAGYRLVAQVLAGLEGSISFLNYDRTGTNTYRTPDASQWSGGGFVSSQISEYLSTRIDAGYTLYDPDQTSTNLNTSGSGFYFSASVSHRVNKWVNYTLSAGRSTDLAAYGQPQNRYFVQLNPNWTILNKYSITTPVSWQQGSQVSYVRAGAGGNNEYDQYSVGITVGRSLTKKLSGSLSYQYIKETSSGTGFSNYTDDIISLNLTYSF